MPGEISLSHNGVLFLDEIAEFNKKTLDALRQPIEDGKVTISRVKYTHNFPANFMLVAAMNPCHCGYYGYSRCHCTDYEIIKYRQKLSGPSSKSLKEKVEMARNIQRERYKDIKNVRCNAFMTPQLINQYCILDDQSKNIFKSAYDRFRYSARTYHKFLRVARTFADMECSEEINKSHIIKALMCREIEKEQATMVVI